MSPSATVAAVIWLVSIIDGADFDTTREQRAFHSRLAAEQYAQTVINEYAAKDGEYAGAWYAAIEPITLLDPDQPAERPYHAATITCSPTACITEY